MQPLDKKQMRFGSRAYWAVLGVALAFPTLLTWAYFVLLADTPPLVQQAVYGAGKCLQFALPVLWVWLVLRTKSRWAWGSGKSAWIGIAFGAAVLAGMFLLYHVELIPAGQLQMLGDQARTKVQDLGLDSLGKYAATGLFYALAHSFLEEYYWRWFVFGQLRRRMGFAPAMAFSSLGFMAHHVVLLGTYFGFDSPFAYVFSLAVAVGGAVWAWLYESSRSLIGPWLSHMIVDAAIFVVGYDLVKDCLS
jgi:membrane protease YdiL (CAAX protease family)